MNKLLIIVFFLSMMAISNAQLKLDSLDLYLLIGQSNMAGRGPMTDEFKNEMDTNVLMLNKENEWVVAKHPLHFDKPAVAGIGPGLSFGIELAKSSRKKIGLIPCAVGGTSIDAWVPGGSDKATSTHPYDEAMERVKAAIRSGDLKGVIWLQGESDSDSAKAKMYLDKLIELISRLRKIANNEQLPFVAGELGRFKEQYQNINIELKKLSAHVSNTTVATSEGLTDKGDKTHFDSRSAEEYGRRFAEKMQLLEHK